jgi:hypothetical protein
MHGQFYRELERTSVDKEKSMVWLCSSGLKGVTESLTIATQDQALNMCHNQRNIMKQPTDNKFRTFYKAEEHMKLIVLGRTTLAPSEYTNRHKKVAGYIHWAIRKLMGLHVTDKYNEHMTEMAINVKGTTIMWDVPVIRDRKILANRTGTVLQEK